MIAVPEPESVHFACVSVAPELIAEDPPLNVSAPAPDIFPASELVPAADSVTPPPRVSVDPAACVRAPER